MTVTTFRSFVCTLFACSLLLVSPWARAAEPGPAAPSLVPEPDPPDAAPLGDGTLPPAALTRETECSDRVDNDGDVVVDCGDADCKDDVACKPARTEETGELRCSDWLDNDEDGIVDCDDDDCDTASACHGSYDLELAGAAPPSPAPTSLAPGLGHESEAAAAQQYGDKDGERDNLTCSDGIDNDDDGRVDCDDIGCRLDTQVMVCQPASGFRLSVVARVAQSYDVQERQTNTEFTDLQLRLLGQIPFIQNSFFLVSSRVEKTPRITFAMFQIPLGRKGHYVNINSGGGSLSIELLHSVHKRLLADPAYYVYNAFEQGNGAAVEFGGPLDKHGRFLYRTYLAGGSGRYAGNIGGTFFPDDNRNFTWTVGGQVWMNLVGFYSRWDSPFLYTPAPLTVAFAVGAKYDQRSQERYPAVNAQFVFRWWRVHLTAENYTKRELAFKNWQTAYNVQLGLLVVKQRLLLAGDFGQYLATEFEDPPLALGYDLRRQLGEMQYRAAAHVFLWRDVFFATLIWRDQRQEPGPNETGIQVAQDARLLLTYRW